MTDKQWIIKIIYKISYDGNAGFYNVCTLMKLTGD